MANCQPSDGKGSAKHKKYVGVRGDHQLQQKDNFSTPYKGYDKTSLIEMNAPGSNVAVLP